MKRLINKAVWFIFALLILSSLVACTGTKVSINHLEGDVLSGFPARSFAVYGDEMYFVRTGILYPELCKTDNGRIKVLGKGDIFEKGFINQGSMQIAGDMWYGSGSRASDVRENSGKTTTYIAEMNLITDETRIVAELPHELFDEPWQVYDQCLLYILKYDDIGIDYSEDSGRLYMKSLNTESDDAQLIDNYVQTCRLFGDELYYVRVQDGLCKVYKGWYSKETELFNSFNCVYEETISGELLNLDVGPYGIYLHTENNGISYSRYTPFDAHTESRSFEGAHYVCLYDRSAYWEDAVNSLYHTDLTTGTTTLLGKQVNSIQLNIYPVSNEVVYDVSYNGYRITKYNLHGEPDTVFLMEKRH